MFDKKSEDAEKLKELTEAKNTEDDFARTIKAYSEASNVIPKARIILDYS